MRFSLLSKISFPEKIYEREIQHYHFTVLNTVLRKILVTTNVKHCPEYIKNKERHALKKEFYYSIPPNYLITQ